MTFHLSPACLLLRVGLTTFKAFPICGPCLPPAPRGRCLRSLGAWVGDPCQLAGVRVVAQVLFPWRGHGVVPEASAGLPRSPDLYSRTGQGQSSQNGLVGATGLSGGPGWSRPQEFCVSREEGWGRCPGSSR